MLGRAGALSCRRCCRSGTSESSKGKGYHSRLGGPASRWHTPRLRGKQGQEALGCVILGTVTWSGLGPP